MAYSGSMAASDMLKPLDDLEFHSDIHRYRYRGNWLRYSVSRIAQPTTPEQRMRLKKRAMFGNLAAIMYTQQPKHYYLALNLSKVIMSHGLMRYAVAGLLQGAETMATELGVVIPHHEVAGTFDGLIKTSDGAVVLLDFKTVQTDKAVDTRKPATAQLGGYLHGLNINRPMIDVDKCCTVVVGPGRSKVISEDPDLCFAAWEDKLSIHKIMTELPF
jgi:hypothetical protein